MVSSVLEAVSTAEMRSHLEISGSGVKSSYFTTFVNAEEVWGGILAG